MKRLLVVLFVSLVIAASAAAQRLPGTAIPEHYTLWFAPDFHKDNFRGRETVKVQITKPTTAITLHAAEIEFGEVRVISGARTQRARVTLDEKRETATLTVPRRLPAGPATIEISYLGILNDKLRGFYLSQANGRKYAVSQMEATDARRAFPCFDEPAYKAVFDISVMADAGDTVISNASQVSDTPGPEPGKHTVKFGPTPKMSTYLVAMLVGDFVCRDGSSDGIPVRVCSTPDKKGLTGFALEATEQQVKFYNDYFGIRYPFGKLDIVGIPDFAAGAMENTGAITFREQYLLADPERASLEAKKNIASILSHEIAHQWFGDLVTMKWWDDIWLNEGFATWMASKPLAVWRPDWHVELDDVEDTQKALALDALRSTRPIRTKVETPEEINEVFDAIAYEKSAAVLRMIEAYVGEDTFRKSVASYLKKYSYANAGAEDFWTEVTRVSGKPVDRIMASYVDQPGVPALTVATECRGSNTEVMLRQERFIGAPGAAAAGPRVWTLPVCIRGGRCELFSAREQTFTVAGCGAAIFINAGSEGYYFSEYAPQMLAALAREQGRLTPAERLGLIGDEWWMVRAGRHDIGAFLDVAAALADDPATAVTGGIATRLAFAAEYLVDTDDQPRFQGWIRDVFAPTLERLGLSGDESRDDDRQGRRAELVWLLGVWGNSGDVQRRSRELAIKYMTDPDSLDGTLAPVVLQVSALGGDATLYDEYAARLKQLESNPEEYYRYFNALPFFREPALVQRTLRLAISRDVRTQDTGSLIAGVLARPWGRDAAWDFTKQQWTGLVKRLGVFQGMPNITSALGSFCSTEATHDIKRFFERHHLPAVERSVRRAVESVESCAALHARQSPALAKWLRQVTTHPASR